jgi:hypothetical protein
VERQHLNDCVFRMGHGQSAPKGVWPMPDKAGAARDKFG